MVLINEHGVKVLGAYLTLFESVEKNGEVDRAITVEDNHGVSKIDITSLRKDVVASIRLMLRRGMSAHQIDCYVCAFMRLVYVMHLAELGEVK